MNDFENSFKMSEMFEYIDSSLKMSEIIEGTWMFYIAVWKCLKCFTKAHECFLQPFENVWNVRRHMDVFYSSLKMCEMLEGTWMFSIAVWKCLKCLSKAHKRFL